MSLETSGLKIFLAICAIVAITDAFPKYGNNRERYPEIYNNHHKDRTRMDNRNARDENNDDDVLANINGLRNYIDSVVNRHITNK